MEQAGTLSLVHGRNCSPPPPRDAIPYLFVFLFNFYDIHINFIEIFLNLSSGLKGLTHEIDLAFDDKYG